MNWRHTLVAAFLFALAVEPAGAAIRLPGLVGDNMVLQRDAPIRLWGWADAGEQVSIRFGDETANAQADSGGRWSIALKSRPAGGPYRMTLTGANQLKLENILIGDVWLASGQSNMEWPLTMANDASREIETASFPQIRLIAVQHEVALQPQKDHTTRG